MEIREMPTFSFRVRFSGFKKFAKKIESFLRKPLTGDHFEKMDLIKTHFSTPSQFLLRDYPSFGLFGFAEEIPKHYQEGIAQDIWNLLIPDHTGKMN